jgi:PPP family 3-phenylpropionic acid transporter
MAPSAPPPALRLSAFYFFYLAALGAFSPFFPLYLETRGLSPWLISVMMSLWYGTRIVAPSAWDFATQRASRPVLWLRGGAVATIAAFAGFLLPWPLAGLVAVMAVFAFFYNAIMPQFEALTLSHLVGDPARYGRIRVWGSVGFIIAVLALGAAFERVSVATLPYWMLPLFALMVAATWANDYAPGARGVRGERESLLDSLARPGVALFLTLAFLMQVAHGPYYVFFSIYLDEHGYRPGALGTLWAVGVMAEIVVFWFAAPLLTRFGAARAMRWCLAAATVRFAATALLPGNVVVLVLAQVAHALTFGLFHAACIARAARLFPGALQGQGQGLMYGLGSGLGGVAGSLLAGLGWRLGGGELAFAFAAGAALVGFALAWRAQPLPQKREVGVVKTDEAQ